MTKLGQIESSITELADLLKKHSLKRRKSTILPNAGIVKGGLLLLTSILHSTPNVTTHYRGWKAMVSIRHKLATLLSILVCVLNRPLNRLLLPLVLLGGSRTLAGLCGVTLLTSVEVRYQTQQAFTVKPLALVIPPKETP